tara:strand:+ start:112 stop:255 length:144 start_codon:yes stop_codon:yes gene_type:complete
MHQHVIINHDVGLFVVVISEEEEIDLTQAIDEIILKEIKHAEGSKKA